MEPNNTLTTLICVVVPCLLLLAIAGAAFFFISKRRKRAAAKPITSVTPPGSGPFVATPAPIEQTPATGPSGSTTDFKSAPLSPSELVALRAAEFAQPAGLINSYKPLVSEAKVQGPELAQSLVAAAFLALEAAGDLTLETGRKKNLLIGESDALFANPVEGSAGGWQAGSYEEAVLASATKRASSNQNVVKYITSDVLLQDASVPWDQAITVALNGLYRRGLLETVKQKMLIGSVDRLALPESTAQLAAAQDAGAVKALLARCQSERPQLWAMLTKEIKKGFESRYEAPDAD